MNERARAIVSGRAGRIVGLVVGWLLVMAAIGLVVRQRSTLAEAWAALATPDPGLLALLAGAVVLNLVLSAAFLRVLITRYGRVGAGEMQALVAAATLLNFLPLRPGLFGRIAYHRAVNGIAAADTVKTIVQALVISVALAAYLGLAVVVAAQDVVPLLVGVAVPVPMVGAGLFVARWRRWAGAILLRHIELIVWAVRYHAAFALIGHPVSAEAALAFACVSAIANLVPFVSNGLGLREWAIGWLAPILTAATLGLGVTAELVNRAVEIAIVAVAGLLGLAWLSRHARSLAVTRGGEYSPDQS